MIYFLIVATLALGPLQWITLADVGLQLKPVHVPFFALSAIGWAGLVAGKVRHTIARQAMPFALFFTAYLYLLLLSFMINGIGLIIVIKYTTYFIGAAGWFFAMTFIERDRTISALTFGGILASVVFFLAVLITLQLRDINLFSVIGNAITTGDTNLLHFKIFVNVFNPPGFSSDELVNPALRHTSLGFIFIGVILAFANTQRARIATATAILGILIILVSVSRTQIIVLVLALLPPYMILSIVRPRFFLIGAMCIGVLASILALNMENLSGVPNILEQRFGNFGEDARVDQIGQAWSEINDRLLLGHGPGYTYDYGGRVPHSVHNVILGAWMQGGIVCLLAAIGFTVSLGFIYLRGVAQSINRIDRMLVFSLLVLPLLSSQVYGGGYNLAEWLCIAIVMALVIPGTSTRQSDERYRKN